MLCLPTDERSRVAVGVDGIPGLGIAAPAKERRALRFGDPRLPDALRRIYGLQVVSAKASKPASISTPEPIVEDVARRAPHLLQRHRRSPCRSPADPAPSGQSPKSLDQPMIRVGGLRQRAVTASLPSRAHANQLTPKRSWGSRSSPPAANENGATAGSDQPHCARCRSRWSASTSATIASATGTPRMATQGSCRPLVEISASSPWTVTVCCGTSTELVGLTAIRATMSWPEEMPPRVPPALFDRKVTAPLRIRMASLCSGPDIAAAAKPEPISTPLTAGMLIRPLARSASSRSNTGAPRPAGTPDATTSTMPPADEPSLRLSLRKAAQVSAARASGLHNELRSTSSQSQRARSIGGGPTCTKAARMRIVSPGTLG